MSQTWRNLVVSTLITLVLTTSAPLNAQETGNHYDRIALQTQATREVETDTQIAVLYVQKEGPELAPATAQVNRMIREAVEQAKQIPAVTVTTLGYQTYPIYQQQTLSGWRVRQSIRLESRHSNALSDLLGKLQSTLALDSIHYTLSNEKRDILEEQLILQAIDAFRHRAEQITRQMGRTHYRVVEMTIHTGGQSPEPSPMRARMMALESSVPAPTLEGGTQTVQVGIDGQIELQTE